MSASTGVISVLLADDHELVRAGVAMMVNRQPDMTVVAEAADGGEAVSKYAETRPDIALIDLRMPHVDGVDCVRRIRALDPGARIVVLTTFDTEEDIQLVLTAGASGYLLKDATEAELVACVRTVLSGGLCVAPAAAAKLAERLQRAQLTSRELDVLKLMARGQTNREIAHGLFISESTVKLHANNMFTKLGVSSRTEAMTVALRRGLVRLPQ